MILSFKDFVTEMHFSPRRQMRIGLTQAKEHVTRQVYNGWEIWFWNREEERYKQNIPKTKFAGWVYEHDDEINNAIINQLKQYAIHNKEEWISLKDRFKQLSKAYHYNNEEGWSSELMYPEEHVRHRYQQLHDKLDKMVINDDEMKDKVQLEKNYHNDWEEGGGEYANSTKIFKRIERGEEINEKQIIVYVNAALRNLFNNAAHNAGIDWKNTEWLTQQLQDHGQGLKIRNLIAIDYDIKGIIKDIKEKGVEKFLDEFWGYIAKFYHGFLKKAKNVFSAFIPAKNNLDTVQYKARKAIKVVSNNVLKQLANQFSLNINDFKISDKIDFENEDLIKNIAMEYENHKSIEELMGGLINHHISELINDSASEYNSIYLNNNPDTLKRLFSSYIQRGMSASIKVINVLTSFGLRRYHRVPIMFFYQSWGQPSGFGNVKAMGLAHPDHVRIFGNVDEKNMISVLAHELGHIVFSRLSGEEQAKVLNLAKTITPANNYGRLDFVYPGLTQATQNHTSGNEWFATAIEYFATNYNNKVPSLDQLTLMKGVKNVLATASSQGNPWKTYQMNDPAKIRPPRRLAPRKVEKDVFTK